jgi:SAM-dependent methyltransferase
VQPGSSRICEPAPDAPGRLRFALPYSRLASAYDASVGLRDFARSRAAFEALVRRHHIHFDSAVDLGCGTGLFARYLRRRWGVPVLAVDRSPEMLEVAQRNCADPGVRFLQQDLRSLSLPIAVDLATANTFTLNHLMNGSELRVALQRIRQALRPAGHLIFDLLTDEPGWQASREYRSRFCAPGRKFVQSLRWDPRRRLLRIAIVHRIPASPAQVEIYSGRGYSPAEMERRLAEAGFAVRGIYDADTLRIPIAPAERVVVVARHR